MKTHKFFMFAIVSSLLLLGSEQPSAYAQPYYDNFTLTEIDLGLSGSQTLKEWYDAESSYTGNDTYFSAYITLPVGDDLYVGLGTARAGEEDGAYLAKFDGSALSGIGDLDEQGFHEMIWDGSLVHIAGSDPTDDHTAGNHYTYQPGGSLTKYRDASNGLPNVVHSWGLWQSGNTLYEAASTYDNCASGDLCGQIFSSTDDGETWTKESDLGEYRAYDIFEFNGSLYAIYNDEYKNPLTLAKSTDNGKTWNDIPGLTENIRRVHIIEFNNELLVVSWDRAKIYSLDASDNISTHNLPSLYKVGASYSATHYSDYNIMAVADGYLYLIAEEQGGAKHAIIRTTDLSNWEWTTNTNEKLTSLSYWENKNWLVTCTAGTNAKLLKIELQGTPSAVTMTSFQARNQGVTLWKVAAFLLSTSVLGFLKSKKWRN
ncbi:MAG: hypothetical protein B6243_00215 [Anaerolineaceae bacterium 4572_5.2]|nr:MAG: hypothetical protein B6243_00215 [Anaerolineaceae bacterium 4572_5.2]